ncbi:MAG: nitrogen regulation protein NR(II) [Candidatus Competibacterales bacterium]
MPMRIALKNTLVFTCFYTVAFVLAVMWLDDRVRVTYRDLMANTAQLLGEQVLAVLHQPVVEQLLGGDVEGLAQLRQIVGTAADRSTTLGTIDVVNLAGEVVVSDSRIMEQARLDAASEVFAAGRQVVIDSDFQRRFTSGVHTLRLPLVIDGSLVGYLRLVVRNRPIVELYSDTLVTLLWVALVGLLAIGGFGLLLQVQLNGLDHRLARYLEAIVQGQSPPRETTQHKPPPDLTDTQAATAQLESALDDARGRAQVAEFDLDTLGRALQVGLLWLTDKREVGFVNHTARRLLLEEVDHNDPPAQNPGAGRGDAPGAEARLEEPSNSPKTRFTGQGGHPPTGTFDQALGHLLGAMGDVLNDLYSGSKLNFSGQTDLTWGRRLRVDIYPFDEEGCRGMLVLLRDQLQMEALEEDLRTAAQFRNLSRLYRGAVHDLRAPLNAMVINLELLKQSIGRGNQRGRLAPPDHYMQVLGDEIHQLNRALEQLLTQTMPGTQGDQPTSEAVDLVNLVEEIARLVAPQARQGNIDFTVDLCPGPVVVEGSSVNLKQAFLNLVINGLEALERGGHLSIAMGVAGNRVHFTVADNGSGIPPQILEHIFEMHYTTKGSGTGIGLYVAKTIVERHGGAIQVETQLGQGTRFLVALPLRQRGADPGGAPPPPTAADRGAGED